MPALPREDKVPQAPGNFIASLPPWPDGMAPPAQAP